MRAFAVMLCQAEFIQVVGQFELFGSGDSLSPMKIPVRKASFLLEECTLLVLDPNKKRSLTKYHGKLTHYLY